MKHQFGLLGFSCHRHFPSGHDPVTLRLLGRLDTFPAAEQRHWSSTIRCYVTSTALSLYIQHKYMETYLTQTIVRGFESAHGMTSQADYTCITVTDWSSTSSVSLYLTCLSSQLIYSLLCTTTTAHTNTRVVPVGRLQWGHSIFCHTAPAIWWRISEL